MFFTSDIISNLTFINTKRTRPQDASLAPSRSRMEPAPSCLMTTFIEVASRRDTHPAISTSDSTWDYRSLLAAALSIARKLKDDPGYKPGNRVILLTPNSVEYVAAFYGILMAKCVVVPLAANLENGIVENILESTEATMMITTPRILKRRPHLQDLTLAEDHQSREVNRTNTHDSTGQLAAIFFTSGSSGTPKGVMLSHTNLISNSISIQKYLKLNETERPLCILPFHHAFGNSVLQSHLLMGAHLILDGNTTFPETIIQALVKHECTSLSAVPDLFRTLLERTSFKKIKVPRLRYMSVAGGALEYSLSLEINQHISPARFFVMYGQTEATARLAYVPPEHLLKVSDGCIGQAIPGVKLEVVDKNGHSVRPGEVGEVRAQGPNIMQGYWRDPAGTQERIRNGWLYTGDLATIDDSSWIIIKGRSNALLKISGYRVHPADLEEFALRTFPIVQAVAVPFESNNVGTRLALYVKKDTSQRDLSSSEMIAICRKKLPRQMIPDHISIVESFPLNHAMKIDRMRLSQRVKETVINQEK
ncbi:MAG: AMP-binding protein [Planctomycetes bacterium]|nr:AMP-binding protein [Planctomycetota bacterium]MCH9724893.1 AMP-binding protein [Planctomycetota bacterium]MCH9776852.1 AMP-binding protein [Planctomycetota bacterium]MCH9792223.1 AMP-binding protein [Planctomycetota bacterium]